MFYLLQQDIHGKELFIIYDIPRQLYFNNQQLLSKCLSPGPNPFT